ncbi:MAG TPA: STN domain-containing protein [Vicinamibacteria bacterium]|nr:STN domain-containing protein [Vicinamibacteria bacterium]
MRLGTNGSFSVFCSMASGVRPPVGVAVPTGGIVADGMRLRLALALSLLATPSHPEVQVTLRDGRVVVRATGAPLAEVLKSFAEATGTEVVYDATRPRQLVTVAIEAGSAAEALAQLLEGQGLNYVLRLDPTGKVVEMLFVAGSASPSPTPAGSARNRARPPSFRPPEERAPEEPDEIEPSLAPEGAEGVDPSAGSPPGDAANPVPGEAWPGIAPGVTPDQEPSGSGTPPGSTPPQPGQPQPPAPASYPGGFPPPAPQPPVPPGPASYPR